MSMFRIPAWVILRVLRRKVLLLLLIPKQKVAVVLSIENTVQSPIPPLVHKGKVPFPVGVHLPPFVIIARVGSVRNRLLPLLRNHHLGGHLRLARVAVMKTKNSL